MNSHTQIKFNESGGANFSGIITASNGAASGAGAKIGNIKVGFDNLYNLFKPMLQVLFSTYR